MHRLFVAARPPRAIRERLLALSGGIHGVRWQSDEQLHLTLRFIGEVDRHRAEDVALALSSVRFPPFELTLSGAGHFGQGSRRGSLWIGVAPRDRLAALHSKVDQACVRAGLAPEGRAFHPHITIGRTGRTSGPVEPFLGARSATASEAFAVADFGLYESVLAPDGPVYTLAQRYRLG